MKASANAGVLLGLVLAVSSSGLARLTPPLTPDPKLTPGGVLPVTKADICVPGYSKKVRNVPEAVKRQAYAEYGITSHKPGEYEVDHLISLELGGQQLDQEPVAPILSNQAMECPCQRCSGKRTPSGSLFRSA